MTIRIEGQLEVDSGRGVIYFHSNVNGATLLRICGLKKELKEFDEETQVDITHGTDAVMISHLP